VTKLGITGWKKDDAEWGVAKCFRAWCDERGIVGDLDLDNGVRHVIGFIEAYGSSRFEASWEADAFGEPLRERIIDRAGFRKKDDQRHWHYYVLPEQWKKLTGSYRTADLTREMINRKLLIPNPEGKNSVSIRVPGHGQMRLYHLAPMGEPEAT